MPLPHDAAAWSDQTLVEHCLAQDEIAWFELDRRYHVRLEVFCHRSLQRQGFRDWNVAADLAETVLSSLMKHNCRRLRSWQAAKRKFLTHLIFFARRVLHSFFAIRERRQSHERVLDPQSLQKEVEQHAPQPEDAEANANPGDAPLPHLTPAQRKFLERLLNHEDMRRHYKRGYYDKLKAELEKKIPSLQIPPYPKA